MDSISAFNSANGHFYFLTYPVLGTDWTSAQVQAAKAGGNLVTINNVAEQQFLNQAFDINVSYGGVLYKESLWIGMYEPHGDNTFEWVSGEPVTYTNWAAGEPNSPWEQYGELNPTFAPGKWNDRSDYASEVGGRGIVEVVPDLLGTAGNNVLSGTGLSEVIVGLGGADKIYGNGGGDYLFGGDGNDTIAGSSACDFVSGGKGDDVIYGNGGPDILIGDIGNDTIYGGSARDTILGGSGNDTIYANGGSDFIDSGSGLDTIWLGSGGIAQVYLEQGSGYDVVKNFQLGSTVFKVGSLDGLTFADSSAGARILQNGDLLGVVSWQNASTFGSHFNDIFVV